jgi:hypothetical protein
MADITINGITVDPLAPHPGFLTSAAPAVASAAAAVSAAASALSAADTNYILV